MSDVLSLWKGWLVGPDRKMTMKEIAIEVASRHGIDLAVMKSPSKVRDIVWPRQEAMATMYETGRYSNLQIAQFFGLTDHTTVVHARRAHRTRVESYAQISPHPCAQSLPVVVLTM